MRAVTEKLYEHAQQSGAKLVHIPQAELLTEAAANALLKTTEEPTENTWFVLQSQGNGATAADTAQPLFCLSSGTAVSGYRFTVAATRASAV